MPISTRVDHHSRRREVARAAWKVIQRKGLDRSGIRDIADELHGTVSTVTHYFRTRDELIRFACDEVFVASRARLGELFERQHGLAGLEQVLLAGLPVEPGREIGWEVWIAFLGHAIGRPEARAQEADRERGLRDMLAGHLSGLQRQGDIPTRCDVPVEADLLAALLDGLGLGRIFQPDRYTSDRVALLLRSHLQQRFDYQPR